MKFILFYHSLISDWNHGNAHFLRGIATELLLRGHEVAVFEPRDSWSFKNLLAEHGEAPLRGFHSAYPLLRSALYEPNTVNLDEVLDSADVVVVHEWNDPELIRRIGEHRASGGTYRLLFHDTHHRLVSDPKAMAAYDLSQYDGVLAYGRVLRDLYIREARMRRAWTWHEAADTRVFHPRRGTPQEGDLVWVGNWGDEERTEELHEFLIDPIRSLGLKARVYGVRYPAEARQALAEAGIEYAGWIPNYEVPRIFAQFKITIHVPRRPYVKALPGIPTIRVFEALACGIPLICSPWDDAEKLFTPGKDFLTARSGREMTRLLKTVLKDGDLRRSLSEHGLRTIQKRHTCAHRVDELLHIATELRTNTCPHSHERIHD